VRSNCRLLIILLPQGSKDWSSLWLHTIATPAAENFLCEKAFAPATGVVLALDNVQENFCIIY
jgi:hypothetical protein